MIETSQPQEHHRGQVLDYAYSNDSTTTFKFSAPVTYEFTLEDDGFIQLLVTGNIIKPAKSPKSGLSAVIPHCDGYTRIKQTHMTSTPVFVVSDHVAIFSSLLTSSDVDGGTRYKIEYSEVSVNTAELLTTLEKMIDRGSHSTALVLRPN